MENVLEEGAKRLKPPCRCGGFKFKEPKMKITNCLPECCKPCCPSCCCTPCCCCCCCE